MLDAGLVQRNVITMEVENAQPTASWPARTKEYIEDVQAEMKRVTWPTWPQVRSTTLVVIISTFLLAGYFAVVDAAVNSLITKVINVFSK
jgi:preprotein translocase subunit SecE